MSGKKVSLMDHITSAPDSSKIYIVLADGSYGYILKSEFLAGLNLQKITDNGNTTTNEIKAKWFEFYDIATDTYGKIELFDGSYSIYDAFGNIVFSFDNSGFDNRYNADGFRLNRSVAILTDDRIRAEPDKDGTYAMLDDLINAYENQVKILQSSADDEFAFAHGTIAIGNKMILGTRQGANSKLLRYDGTTLEESITIACSSLLGVESLCAKSDGSRVYGTRRNGSTNYIFDVNPLDFTDINYHTITGVNLDSSPAICTDGTYIYGVENVPSCKFFKIRISDWSTISTNSWTGRNSGHSAKINTADGEMYCCTQSGYWAKVSLSDLSFSELDLTSYLSTATDDMAFIYSDNNSYGNNYCFIGGENRDATTGIGGVCIDATNMVAKPFNTMPTVGMFISNDFTYLYSVSNQGFIQQWNLEDLIYSLIVDNPVFRNTYTYRGNGFPNELLFPTSGDLYMTNWDTVNNTGVLSKIELTPVTLPLITEKESYFNNLVQSTSGAVDSVNGQTGVVVLDADDIADGTTNKAYTATEKTKLSGIASGANVGVVPNSAITAATKTKVTYDAKGLVTSGADATTADIADSTNKRYVTDAQATVIGNTSGTNSGDNATNSQYSGLASSKEDTANKSTSTSDSASTTKFPVWSAILSYFDASRIRTLLGITTLSGSNTGDQDLSSYAPKASPALTGSPTAPTQSQADNSTKIATTAYVDTGLATKAIKTDLMILSSAYVLSNSTSLQKMFNVGSGSGGAFNATANKTYRFRIEFDMTGLSTTSSAISFGFLGTATISSISYKANVLKNALATITAANMQSIQVSTVTAVSSATTNATAKGVIMGIIRVSGAGTIIPAIATGVGNSTSQVEANSFFEITELGSDTVTATSNIS